MNRTDRLLGILLELQAHGEQRAEDIARTFEVSVRTIYRDMEALSETGVPVVATPGKGYRLMEGYFLPPLSFTPAEAALLQLGGEFVRDRVDPELRRAAEGALLKLAGVLPQGRRDEVARRRDELLFTTTRRQTGPSGAPPESGIGPRVPSGGGDDERLARIRAAIGERRVLRLLYHTYRRPAPEPREAEPVKLVYLADAWHLAAYCRLRRASRLFRLDRIDSFDVLEERFTPGERHVVGPDPSSVWDELPEAHVRLDPAVQRWVREQPPFFFRREENDIAGPVVVVSLRDERAVLSWLLSWGAAVEVLDPPYLRTRLADEARLILARHAAHDDRGEIRRHPPAPAIRVSGTPR